MKKIEDEFSEIPFSHQRKSQLRNLRDGKCATCGQPRQEGDRLYCNQHREAKRTQTRNSYRLSRWLPLDAPVKKTRPRIMP